MADLAAQGTDLLTLGQYLQPTREHLPVVRFVPPDEFKAIETIAYAKGFSMVAASPITTRRTVEWPTSPAARKSPITSADVPCRQSGALCQIALRQREGFRANFDGAEGQRA